MIIDDEFFKNVGNDNDEEYCDYEIGGDCVKNNDKNNIK